MWGEQNGEKKFASGESVAGRSQSIKGRGVRRDIHRTSDLIRRLLHDMRGDHRRTHVIVSQQVLKRLMQYTYACLVQYG
jgi:hypothetical protein